MEGKYLQKKKILFVEEKKNGGGKGGKYLEKENVTIAGRTNKQGKIGLLSQWTMEGTDEQIYNRL